MITTAMTTISAVRSRRLRHCRRHRLGHRRESQYYDDVTTPRPPPRGGRGDEGVSYERRIWHDERRAIQRDR